MPAANNSAKHFIYNKYNCYFVLCKTASMLKKHSRYFCLLLTVLLIGCAKRGSISGGLKDTIAPVLKSSVPKNYSTDFKGKTIRLTFDEYIKLKDANKQLVISPPMEKAPEITPSVASKYINIKINDTLQPNTTYSLNFGKSIEDNNEGNPYPQFKYVFSTGSYIDSLSLKGKIKDAHEKKPDESVTVALYEINEKYKDSAIYNQVPRYVATTPDSLSTFVLENLKAGKYLLVALKDANSNYKFNPKDDKIAFHKEYITIPNDTVYELELFKEILPFKANKPTQASGNRLLMGYQGNPANVKTAFKKAGQPIDVVVTKFTGKDSLQLWYKPIKLDATTKTDSLQVNIENDKYTADFSVKFKNQKIDSLGFAPNYKGVLPLREKFALTSTIPIAKFDAAKMQLINKDSVAVAFKTDYDAMKQLVIFDFAKEPLQKYRLRLMPGALVDYMDRENDTLAYGFETKNVSDYGNLVIKLENVRQFPIIVELTDAKGAVLYSEYSESATKIDFNLVAPTLFTLRVIYDENKNKEWDTGNFLEKRQSEEVIYFPKEIDVRANWDVEQTFNLAAP